MKFIIHIGSHKAGSSSLQSFCRVNSDALINRGFFYPLFENVSYPDQHSFIADLLRLGETRELEDAVESMVYNAIKNDCDCIVLSGEELCLLEAIHVGELYRILQDHDVEVIFYVRNYWKYFLSQYNQHLRSFPKRISLEEIHGRVSVFDYVNVLLRWESFFGYKNVNVRIFELVINDLVGDFVTHIGADLGADSEVFEYIEEKSNVSTDNMTATIINEIFEGLEDRDYYKILLEYQSVFYDFESVSNVDERALQFFVNNTAVNLNHPKLFSYVDVLSKVPVLNNNFNECRSGYLTRLQEFLGRVSSLNIC